MNDLIDGTIQGWPASLMLERAWIGAPYTGAHCCMYTDEDDNSAPFELHQLCYSITDACDGLSPKRALAKAMSMGFVPDNTGE